MDVRVLECPCRLTDQMDYFLMAIKERLFKRRTDVQNLTSQNFIQNFSKKKKNFIQTIAIDVDVLRPEQLITAKYDFNSIIIQKNYSNFLKRV